MKVAVINYSGSVGKTLISSYLLAPRLTGAKFYAVETINQSASDLGIENVTSFKGDDFSRLIGEPAEFGKNRTLRFSGHP
ncbi:plasmid stabilization protein [Escherichia coli]